MPKIDPNLKKYEKRVFLAFFALFGTFFVHSMIIGGDAINGYRDGNDFYVSSHGVDTAVSEAAWNLSATLGGLTIVGFAFVFIYTLITKLARL
ncbi:hypothetical protein Q4555_06250 [Octadecabacter sp. 1_MG-2023]|uniref:hypothetical protein n=1 Tax=unclassified Octadecabacter TaxID=196158 RepID=UPI001C0A593F|nr:MULTISPECIES: hypothetical protein [unclassified Octadecabacter]MBU2994448.1 hypothetical protein [Octadecabacter sp. B2R22]MDO6734261.1 hypothetical protein [Octadecabacter sp. 1_MG-2023]